MTAPEQQRIRKTLKGNRTESIMDSHRAYNIYIVYIRTQSDKCESLCVCTKSRRCDLLILCSCFLSIFLSCCTTDVVWPSYWLMYRIIFIFIKDRYTQTTTYAMIVCFFVSMNKKALPTEFHSSSDSVVGTLCVCTLCAFLVFFYILMVQKVVQSSSSMVHNK